MKLMLIKQLTEDTNNVETIDLERADPWDLANVAAKVAVRSAFQELSKRKEKHDRTNDPESDDYEPFDLSIESLRDDAENFMQHTAKQLNGFALKYIEEMIKDLYPEVKSNKK